MMRTVEATIDAEGHLQLKEDVAIDAPARVLVTFLDEQPEENTAAILAETSLADGWTGSEEDEAWKDLDKLPDLDEASS